MLASQVSAAMDDPEAGEAGDFDKMADFLLKSQPDGAIIVDATASEAVSDYYAPWLAKGVHVVTPNKKAGSGDVARWQQCVAAMEATGAMWGDETTVGAGLPILNVLRTDLIATGDKVKTIEVRSAAAAAARTAHDAVQHVAVAATLPPTAVGTVQRVLLGAFCCEPPSPARAPTCAWPPASPRPRPH